jgi:hypothetical protein
MRSNSENGKSSSHERCHHGSLSITLSVNVSSGPHCYKKTQDNIYDIDIFWSNQMNWMNFGHICKYRSPILDGVLTGRIIGISGNRSYARQYFC